MLNKYTNTEATKFLGYEPQYGYHTTIYENKDFRNSRFSLEIKEYRSTVLIEVKLLGYTPLGAAGPHGFSLSIPKIGNWTEKVEEICKAALKRDFSSFPNPVQVNRSVSISNGETVVRDWVADCGTAQSFANKAFELNA